MGMPSYQDNQIALAPDEMLMKDYSEYDGYPNRFAAAGLAVMTGRFSPTYGIPVMKLLFPIVTQEGIR
jgi:hypothetical protein